MGITRIRLGSARVAWTGAAESHLGHNPPRGPHDERCCGEAATAARAAITEGPWQYLTQVHGSEVVRVDATTTPGAEADASVTTERGVALVVATADCAPIALVAGDTIAAVHAGWTGLYKGVVEETVEAMRLVGATRIEAALGPCIGPECYEFAKRDLEPLVAKWGDDVVARTVAGRPAFDLPRAVATELRDNDVDLVHSDGRCTSCSGEHFSHRRTGTTDRQVMVVEQ